MKKYVTLEESCVSGKYLIKFNFDGLPIHNMAGSANVLLARFMGLDFISYCRMCRDVFGAELYSKVGYPVIYFKKEPSTFKLLDILNKRVNLALKLRALEKTV